MYEQMKSRGGIVHEFDCVMVEAVSSSTRSFRDDGPLPNSVCLVRARNPEEASKLAMKVFFKLSEDSFWQGEDGDSYDYEAVIHVTDNSGKYEFCVNAEVAVSVTIDVDIDLGAKRINLDDGIPLLEAAGVEIGKSGGGG